MSFLHFSGFLCVHVPGVCESYFKEYRLVHFMNFIFIKMELTPESLTRNIFTTHGLKIGIINYMPIHYTH